MKPDILVCKYYIRVDRAMFLVLDALQVFFGSWELGVIIEKLKKIKFEISKFQFLRVHSHCLTQVFLGVGSWE